MKGKRLSLGLALVLVLVLVLGTIACTQSGEKKTPILLAGPPPTWGIYTVIAGTSDLVNRHTNLEITVSSYQGAIPIVQALIQKDVQLGAGPFMGTVLMGYRGTGDFKGKSPGTNLRTVIAEPGSKESVIVPKKSGINSIAGLKGKTIAQLTASPNIWLFGALEANGFNVNNDFKWVKVPDYAGAAEALRLGQIDAMFCGDLSGTSYLPELVSAVGPLVPLAIGPEVLTRMKQQHPGDFDDLQTTNVNPGWRDLFAIDAPVPVLLVALPTMTHDQVSTNTIYTYTKARLNFIDETKKIHQLMRDYGASDIQVPSPIPYHEGAIKALKEARMWTDAMDQANVQALKQIGATK